MKKVWTSLLALTLLAGCSGPAAPESGLEKIIVGASPSPHAEILESVKDDLEAKGFELVIEEFDDYVVPNTALEEKNLDANYFQHAPYLDSFNTDYGTHLVNVGAIHFEPLGIYAGKENLVNDHLTVDDIAEGAKIGVPNDGTNEARALQLLASIGIITLKEGVGLAATKVDIVENPKNVEIIELEAKTIPSTLLDLDYGVINGNYALSGEVTDKVCVTESSESEGAQTYANVIAVLEGNEESAKTKALIEVLTSAETKAFIETTYGNLVVPIFE